MGDLRKHLNLAKEKLEVLLSAYEEDKHSVIGDLATKVVEQLLEADAAKNNLHFGTHRDRHEYSNRNYPKEVNGAMKKVWFAYGDLGYDGVNGERAKKVVEYMGLIIEFFEKRLGEKIAPQENVQ